jgi:hypothetical protein
MYARLVGAAWCDHPPHSGCPGCLCGHLQGPSNRRLNMPRNWVLPAPRAHQGVRRIQERLHEGQWRVEFHWHPPAIYLPCLDPGACPVGMAASVSVYAFQLHELSISSAVMLYHPEEISYACLSQTCFPFIWWTVSSCLL